MTNEDLRREVNDWLAAHWRGPGAIIQSMWETNAETRAWHTKVFEARWSVPSWPVEWFGRGLDDEQTNIVIEAFAQVGAPAPGRIASTCRPTPCWPPPATSSSSP